MKAVLYHSSQKKDSLICVKKVSEILLSLGFEVSDDGNFRGIFPDNSGIIFEKTERAVRDADFMVAIGGDGTILSGAKYITGTDTKLVGINTGTLGFMAGLEADQLKELSILATGGYSVSERMTLDVTLPDGEVCTALNEIAIKSDDTYISDFDVFSDGFPIGSYRADGILLSTPSGSTAYALSAGGPVIEPDLKCIEMTLICPHTLSARATVFSPERRITVRNRGSKGTVMTISTDGRHSADLEKGESVEIVRGRDSVKFVDLRGNSFHESICRKMCR